MVPYYEYALDMILDVESPVGQALTEEQQVQEILRHAIVHFCGDEKVVRPRNRFAIKQTRHRVARTLAGRFSGKTSKWHFVCGSCLFSHAPVSGQETPVVRAWATSSNPKNLRTHCGGCEEGACFCASVIQHSTTIIYV